MILAMRINHNFATLKRQDGAEILIGEITSILYFNFSVCKEETTPPSAAEGFHYECDWLRDGAQDTTAHHSPFSHSII